MFRLAVIFAILAVAVAFSPVAMRSNRVRVEMKVENLQSKISRALGVAAMGVALAGPVPAMADGAVSK